MTNHFPLPKSLQSMYNYPQSSVFTTTEKYQIGNYNTSEKFSDKEIFFMSNKPIIDNEWESISKYIKNSPFIKYLHFSSISLGKKGLQSIADIVLFNQNIKGLKIEWNFLNGLIEEFECFCDIISKSQIQILELNNNKLSSVHISAILRLLKSKSLNILNLKWNEIGNDTIRSIIEHIKTNSSIQEIQLGGNKISQETLNELEETIYKNKNNKYNSIVFNSNVSFNNRQISSDDENYMSNTYGFQRGRKTNESFNLIHKNNYNSKQNSPEKNINVKSEVIEEEYRARYDRQLIDNLSLDKRIVELELELKTSKTRYHELKEKLQEDLQNEVDKNNILEKDILEYKECLIKKDNELTQLINDFENRVSDIILENEKLTIENSSISEKYMMLEKLCEEKISNSKESNKELMESMNKALNQLKHENERIRSESTQEINEVLKENLKKLKSSEELSLKLQRENDNLRKELIITKKDLNEFNNSKNIEIKSRESSLLEEESKKLELIIKDFETKFICLNNLLKESYNKNNSFNEEMLKIKKSFSEEAIKLQYDNNNLKNEKDRLNEEISLLSKNYTVFKSQNELKDELIKVSINNNY